MLATAHSGGVWHGYACRSTGHYGWGRSGFYTHDRRRLSQDEGQLLHHRPPAPKPAPTHRGHTEEDWTPIPYWMDGRTDVAETTYTPFDTKPDATPVRLRPPGAAPGSQLACSPTASLITDRDGDTISRPAIAATLDRERHPDLPRGANHLAAWLASRSSPTTWPAVDRPHRSGRARDHHQDPAAAFLLPMAGRLDPLGPPLTLPPRWPWENQFGSALARLRALPLPFLTASDPSAGLLNRRADLRAGRFLSVSCGSSWLHPPAAGAADRQYPLSTIDTLQPARSIGVRALHSLPSPLISRQTGLATSLRWIP